MTAIAAEYSPKIQKRTLKGHRKPVLCLAHSSERLAHYNSSLGNNKATPSQSNNNQLHPSLLLSGSEDGTARLWDLRTRKTSICMVIPRDEGDDGNEVTSVAFHPSVAEEIQKIGASDDTSNEGRESDTLMPINQECTVYASTSNKIYGYDLRHHSATSNTASSPIIKTPHFDLSNLFQCTDEINQLSFSFPKRNDGNSGAYHMAAADDSGEAHVVSTECLPCKYHDEQSPANTTATGKKKPKIFTHAEPSTMAITSSAAFQPQTNNECYMATAGTDCTVKLWDANRPRGKPTSTVQIKPVQSESTTQLCNPPYVHDISWSSSGRLLAAGIGDGSCAILRAEGRRLVEIGRLGYDEGGHSSAVAAVCFPSFGLSDHVKLLSAAVSPKVRKCGEVDDRLMMSAGNDGNIVFWDLGGDMVGSGPLDPVSYLRNCLSPPDNDAEVDKEDAKEVANAMESVDISCQNGKTKKGTKIDPNPNDLPEELLAPSPPKVLFRIAHRQKPNWITCSGASDGVLPTSLFVADTTNNISVYTLPF